MSDGASQLRLVVFLTLLGGLLLAERLLPRRPSLNPSWQRWTGNLLLGPLGTAALNLTLPAGAMGLVMAARGQGLGLWPALAVPDALAIAVTLVFMDLAVYAQHLLSHRIPWLWRLHRVHHTDVHLDVSTATRFHPLELWASWGFKTLLLVLLAPPPLAVPLFAMVLSGTALFNHANLAIPGSLDRLLRYVVVTPDMHRIHHSSERDETDTNFGFALPWWDHLFGTYRSSPRDPHTSMTLGVDGLGAPSHLLALLVAPLQQRLREPTRQKPTPPDSPSTAPHDPSDGSSGDGSVR